MRTVVGVMGGGEASAETAEAARELGRLIAERGWVLLTGGRDAGVMAAASTGAAAAGGLVIGVLPDDGWDRVAEDVDVAVLTGMGDARNVINVLSSHVVIALPGGAGTVSEVAHALKLCRPVITLGFPHLDVFAGHYSANEIADAATPREAIDLASRFVGRTRLR